MELQQQTSVAALLALFYAFDKTRVYIHAFLDTRQQPEMIARRLGI